MTRSRGMHIAHHIPLCDSLPVNCAFEMSVTTLATITYDSPHITDQFLNHHLQSLWKL